MKNTDLWPGASTDIMFITNGSGKILNMVDSGESVFEEDYNTLPIPLSGADSKYRGYVPWGIDNLLPYEIVRLHRDSEVMSSNKQFNIQAGYSGGVRCTLKQKKGAPADVDTELPEEIQDFLDYNPIPYFWLEQQADMKNFFFTVSVIILSNDGSKIVQLLHKEAVYCRFETCNPANGKIEHIFYANWQKSPAWENVEVIPLLDMRNPMGDLLVRMGKKPNADGKTVMGNERKFGIVTKFPTVSNKYYPFHPSWSVFRSGWYDIARLVPKGKKAQFKNGLAIRWQTKIHPQYWENIFKEEGITDPVKKQERRKKEKENFQKFLTGIENSDKNFMSGYYMNPSTGKPEEYVIFTKLDSDTKGGDWITDSEEASNMLCYADNIHPAMVGATPGKAKGSFSGSDKRELFTMKQIMEKPFHDIMLLPFRLISKYNAWPVKWDVPLLMMTTLDKGADAQPAAEDAPATTE